MCSLVCLSWAASLGQAPPAKPGASKADYAQEAFVIEQLSRRQKYENDGTFSSEDTARVRIQSEAGVQQYGLLSYSYASAIEDFEVRYVRVRKPDGSVVETPQENVQDTTAQITREAPFYSDLHEKHVAVKGLSVGDVLEFKTEEHITKPLSPGQFWTSHSFASEQVTLDEELQISVPRDRAVKLKSPSLQPVVTEANGYRTYTWRHANLQHKDESDKRKATELMWQQARGRLPQPDVLMSSFASWEEVGRWYGALQDERVKPTEEITAKAAELTKDARTDEAKLRALYSYVGAQFRYIGVAFGIGRYQPHRAADVLANQYGDCKDKHALLASLLTATGIPAYPALISASHEVDPDVPSPGQFDHVITVVPRPDGLVWLDTTSEVAPYQFLLAPLRDKHALAIWKDKPAELVKTPADLPYRSTQTFTMAAKLDDAGTLVGQVDVSSRGDFEYLLRRSFRAVAVPQWKDLGQRISMAFGFGGEVSEVTASSPEKTDEPFHYSYKYTRKEFGDWANRRFIAPLPSISLPAPADEETLPLGPSWLGVLADIQFRSEVQLPQGYRPSLPAAVHLKKDFAEYESTYEFTDGRLISERHLKTRMPEVPASEREEYKQFVKDLGDDYGTFIPLLSGAGSPVAADGNPGLPSTGPFRGLPGSKNPEAFRLEGIAREEITKHDLRDAISSLYRAVAEDPKFARAWAMLGGLLLMQQQVEAGVDAFHKAMAADPTEPMIPKALGWNLMSVRRFDDAVPVWRDYVKSHSDDLDGPINLGDCLFQLKRYSESAAAYEEGAKTGSSRPDFEEKLGSAYLLAGEREKAAAAFGKLASLKTDRNAFNNAAYQMAQADLQLPLALEYAQKAVRAVEEESQKITLSDLKMQDVGQIFPVSAYWDTLGWVEERMSNLEEAEQYLKAAWKLTQDGLTASHLCQLYEREHKVAAAIQMCRLAIYRIPMSEGFAPDRYKSDLDAAQENLNHLTAAAPKPAKTEEATDVVIRERTFKVPRFLSGTESAEFFVLLSSDGKSKSFKVEDAKFIKGSDNLKLQGKQLKGIDFSVPAPSDVPTRFVRRGILGCYPSSGCSFVLLDPASVHSLD